MEKQRDFKGVWIPKEIYLDDEINWTEKILLIEIDSLDNEKGCFASNKYFANFLSKSEVYISKCISKLKEKGYIYQESFNGRTRVLRSNLRFKLNDKADLNNSLRQHKSKVKGSIKEKFKADKQENTGNSSRRGQKSTSNNTYNNKTEEEEASKLSDNSPPNLPKEIAQKYEQVFSRKLSADMFAKLLSLYSDKKIIMKALEVAEEKADKPAYLLKLLEDWQSKGLTSIVSINQYMINRGACQDKGHESGNKKAGKNKKLHDLEYLEKNGWI